MSSLFILSFGFILLKFISCYSSGSFDGDQCREMNVSHGNYPPQNTEPPFNVHPENVTLNSSEWQTSRINVVLSAKSSNFRGFMLDARTCDNCDSVGTFTLVDPDNSLLICGNRVVVQPNNQRKTSISVFWTPEREGTFFFRAVFVELLSKFWLRQPIILPVQSTTPPPAETTSAPTTQALTTKPTIFTTNLDSHATGTSTAPPSSEDKSTQTNPKNTTTSATIFTTTSNITSKATVAPTSPPQCVQYVRSVLALLLFSRLCFLGGSSLLIIKPVSKKTVTMSASVVELASKTIAAILILIKAIKYECVYECAGLRNVFTALTVTAMVSSLLHTITIFLHCGPSHELRKCWVCAIIVVDLMNTIITTTAIFFGTRCFEECWLSILMGVYVVWEIMLYIGSVCFEQMGKYQRRKKVKQNHNHNLEKRISQWLFMFIIFTVFNVMLTAALMTGVSLTRMINSGTVCRFF
ncbi:putative ferric-chelate reductase 1 isoform X1 [Pseudorasbora parva]|uniref:putative ferric-chelate reductase 1 isoform X1 n=1 Tax=Pseudorasbora parva TaxID=51549 RepID=UPI00351DF946